MSKREEMAAVFAKWRESGQSLMAFGRSEGVPYSRLLYWRKKFERGKEGGTQGRAVELLPVTVTGVPQPTLTSAFEVRLENGIALGVGNGFEELELQRLVATLRAC